MKIEQISEVLSKIKTGPSKWELDTITWHDRLSNPDTFVKFLTRIQYLSSLSSSSQELTYLLELLDEMDDSDINDLINYSEKDAHDNFIEELAKRSAINIIANGKMAEDTLNTSCKLSPNDFILCAKRTQDLLVAIQGLVIKGETLSKDVAGA